MPASGAAGYAEYALTRPNQCVKLPEGLSLADGAIIEPLAVAVHAVFFPKAVAVAKEVRA